VTIDLQDWDGLTLYNRGSRGRCWFNFATGYSKTCWWSPWV